MEMTLGTVQAMSGNCLQQLEEQLRKQREIAAMTKTNVTDELVGNIFEIALNSDENGDMNLSDEEVEKFVKRMEGINGVDVREEKVKAMIANHGRGITCKFIFCFSSSILTCVSCGGKELSCYSFIIFC